MVDNVKFSAGGGFGPSSIQTNVQHWVADVVTKLIKEYYSLKKAGSTIPASILEDVRGQLQVSSPLTTAAMLYLGLQNALILRMRPEEQYRILQEIEEHQQS